MNVFERILKAVTVSRSESNNDRTAFQRAVYQWLGKGQTVWDEETREQYIRKGYEYNPMLYSVVSFIAKKASSIPFYVKEIKPGEKPTRIESHEVIDKLMNPNNMMGYYEFMEMVYSFRLATGNTFIYGVLDDNKRVQDWSELWVLPAQHVEIVSGGYQEPVRGYKLDYGDQQIEFAADRVLHSKMVNLDFQNGSELYGMSPIKTLVRTLDKSNKAYQQQSKQYEHGGPAGLMFNESEMNGWTEPQLDEYYRKFNRRFAGPNNANKIQFANGKVGYIQTGITPVDLGILDDHKASMKDFCRAYNLAPQLFGDDSSATYNNMQEARKAAYTDAIIPEVEAMCAELTRFFMTPYNKGNVRYEICADYSDVEELQKDKSQQVEWMSKAYWITTQRKQELMGEEVDETLPKYMIPMGLMTQEDMTMQTEPMQTDPQKIGLMARNGLDYFKGLKADSYSDYPKSAKNAAKKAIDYKAENDIDCGTQVGWTRANQIANGEPLSLETVKRTYSFLSRAKEYDTGSFTDSDGNEVCGSIMYAAWGGDTMKNWAERIVEAEDEE